MRSRIQHSCCGVFFATELFITHFYNILIQGEIMSAIKKPAPNKPFSMIREFHLADWFTLANAVCGTGALFSMLTYLQTGAVTHVY